jgi:hypothetical protein
MNLESSSTSLRFNLLKSALRYGFICRFTIMHQQAFHSPEQLVGSSDAICFQAIDGKNGSWQLI